jgi:hypothetical protein
MILEIGVFVNGVYDILCCVAIFSTPWHHHISCKKHSDDSNNDAADSNNNNNQSWKQKATLLKNKILFWTKRGLSFLANIHSSVFSSPIMQESNNADEEDEECMNLDEITTTTTCIGEEAAFPNLQRRIVGYWILTYGLVRCMAALFLLACNDNNDQKKGLFFVLSSTYFVEGFAFASEDLLFISTVRSKSMWVYGTSFVLAVLTLLGGLDAESISS